MAITPQQAGKSIQRAIRMAVDKASEKAADRMQSQAKADAPVDTGALRASLKAKAFRNKNRVTIPLRNRGTAYGRMHDRGSIRHGAGSKFMQRAVTDSGDQLERDLERELNNLVLPDIQI